MEKLKGGAADGVPDSEFDPVDLEQGIEHELEHTKDRETAKEIAKDHLIEDPDYYHKLMLVESKSGHSREYLEAFHASATKQLQPWQMQLLHKESLPTSGGTAGRRKPEHSAVEAALLKKISPSLLADEQDESLFKMWDELDKHFKLARKKRLDTEDYERAASFIAQEISSRGMALQSGGILAKAAIKKSTLFERVEMLPEEIDLGPAIGIREDLSISHLSVLADDQIVDLLRGVGIKCSGVDPLPELDDLSESIYNLTLRKSCPSLRDESQQSVVINTSGRGMFSKAIQEKRVIWYVAAEPGTKDTYDHIITADEVEDLCHRFILGPRLVFIEHGEEQGLNKAGQWPSNLAGKAVVVESGLLPCAIDSFFGEPLPRPAPMGSWIVAVHYNYEPLWNELKNIPHGISWRGPAEKVVL